MNGDKDKTGGDMMHNIINEVVLSGTIIEPFHLEHISHGVQLNQAKISVNRQEGGQDEIIIIMPNKLLSRQRRKKKGDRLAIKGDIRVWIDKHGSKLYAFAKEILPGNQEDYNQVSLEGNIKKEPVYQLTPLGRNITNLLLDVKGFYDKRYSIPCVFWKGYALYTADMPIGTRLKVKGRLQSRNYCKKYEDGTWENKTAYEVSVSSC